MLCHPSTKRNKLKQHGKQIRPGSAISYVPQGSRLRSLCVRHKGGEKVAHWQPTKEPQSERVDGEGLLVTGSRTPQPSSKSCVRVWWAETHVRAHTHAHLRAHSHTPYVLTEPYCEKDLIKSAQIGNEEMSYEPQFTCSHHPVWIEFSFFFKLFSFKTFILKTVRFQSEFIMFLTAAAEIHSAFIFQYFLLKKYKFSPNTPKQLPALRAASQKVFLHCGEAEKSLEVY